MYVCVFMYVYVCRPTYVCMYVCMHVSEYVTFDYTYININAWAQGIKSFPLHVWRALLGFQSMA